MPRIRQIKPEFFIDDDVALLDPLARLLFIGLWTLADKEGRLEDRPVRIKAQIQPYDNTDTDKQLLDIEALGFIHRYIVEGKRYIQIRTFTEHQHFHHKEIDSTIPAPGTTWTSPSQAPVQSGPNPDQTPVKTWANPGPTPDLPGACTGQEPDKPGSGPGLAPVKTADLRLTAYGLQYKDKEKIAPSELSSKIEEVVVERVDPPISVQKPNHSESREEKITPQAQAYVDAGGRWPPGNLNNGVTKKANAIKRITEEVRSDDIGFWKEVVSGYCAAWSSKSYTAMLEWYGRREIPGKSKFSTNGSGNGGRNGCRNGDVALIEERARTRAVLEKWKKQEQEAEEQRQHRAEEEEEKTQAIPRVSQKTEDIWQ